MNELLYKYECANCHDIQYLRGNWHSTQRCNVCNSLAFGLKTKELILENKNEPTIAKIKSTR